MWGPGHARPFSWPKAIRATGPWVDHRALGMSTTAVTLQWKIAPPREVSCLARRGGPRSPIRCERPALHHYGCPGPVMALVHAARGRRGQWFFW